MRHRMIPARRSRRSADEPVRHTRTVVSTMAATAMVAVPLVLAAPAHAGGAESQFAYSFDFGPESVTSVCPFTILGSGHVDARGNSFDGQDSNGNLTITHSTETDTFTGPSGHTLVSLPYSATSHYTDAGVNGVSGFLEVIPLDNGTLFKSNGHVDFNTFTGDWVMVPDSGHAGDVAEFCAELA
jgi:hypothetical protein